MSKAILIRRRVDPWILLFGPLIALSCSGNPDRQTLAGLRAVEPDLAEVTVADGVDQAMEGYQQFLAEAPTSSLTPEAMRRLADLKLEKEYGLLGQSNPRATARSTPKSSVPPFPSSSHPRRGRPFRRRLRTVRRPPSSTVSRSANSKREQRPRASSPSRVA